MPLFSSQESTFKTKGNLIYFVYVSNLTFLLSRPPRFYLYMPFTAIVVFYTCGIYSKYKVLAEQDKFDEESQIEAVTIEDAGTEDVTDG